MGVKVGLDGSNLITDVYSKDIDTHQYLDNSSCHLTHVKKVIPHGQALRLRRIRESDQTSNER